ncbi:unnamed protein product, partial [Rotaria sp. Silwood1]
MPTGTILLYSGSASKLIVSDNQWLFCNGSEVSRSTYRALFVVIGTTYGAGNGVDTFNLPDLRARFPFGSANLADNSFASGGAASHTLTVAELPAHTHDQGSLQTQNTVFGRAGIGKSTFCRYAAYQWATGAIWPEYELVVLIPLRSLTEQGYQT